MTLRLRADYLAITTFGVAISIQLVALNLQGLTGGPFGIAFIPRPFAALQGNALLFNLANFLLVGLSAAVVYLALERLVRGPWGRVLRAISEDEAAAASLGKNANAYRLQAFALGGALMGLGRGDAGPFHRLHRARQLSLRAHLPGLGDAHRRRRRQQSRGALVGAVVVWGLWSASSALTAAIFPPEYQARAAALQIVLIGVLLAAILLLRPRGLLGEHATVSRFVARRPVPRSGEAVNRRRSLPRRGHESVLMIIVSAGAVQLDETG